MSKVIRVTVLCPKGRRETVNLSPNSSVLQILDEVCKKQNLNPDEFDVCHYKKPLDLSTPVRFANLPNNAQLELKPSANAHQDRFVTVALQLESGERRVKEFVPSTTVWDILEGLSDAGFRESSTGEPMCIYMRQKLMGDALKNTTLRSLGLTKGSAVLRLIYRNPDDVTDQAHVSSPLTRPPKETVTRPFIAEPLEIETTVEKKIVSNETSKKNYFVNFNEMKADTINFPQTELNMPLPSVEIPSNKDKTLDIVPHSESDLNSNEVPFQDSHNLENSDVEKMEVDSNMDEEVGAIHYIGGKSAVIFSLNDVTSTKKADLPDDFFELTVDDVRYMMEEYRKARLELENQPLMTKEMRKVKLLQKLGHFKQTVIRIYFPERLVLQAVFEVDETVQDVCDFIKNYLEEETLNFYLYTAPPKEIKNPMHTLLESMLVPAAVVYFGSEAQCTHYLKSSLKDKITDPRAAALAAYESRKQFIPSLPADVTESVTTVVTTEDKDSRIPCSSSMSSESSEKVPKWLKLSK